MTAANNSLILSIDIGGTNIKATLLDSEGNIQAEYIKAPTPSPAGPKNVLETIKKLASPLTGYGKISVGFPGYVKNGVVGTAPNLSNEGWKGTDLATALEKTLGKPTRVVNDADMQGLGVVDGKGLELVVTLGTGFGTALLLDGRLLPHLELAHHPITKSKDYDQYIGEKPMLEIGLERWNTRMQKVFGILKTVFNYDTLYIGGGNAKKLNFKLDKNMRIISNQDGIKGGARLWKD